jgi:hypothetical protein
VLELCYMTHCQTQFFESSVIKIAMITTEILLFSLRFATSRVGRLLKSALSHVRLPLPRLYNIVDRHRFNVTRVNSFSMATSNGGFMLKFETNNQGRS